MAAKKALGYGGLDQEYAVLRGMHRYLRSSNGRYMPVFLERMAGSGTSPARCATGLGRGNYWVCR